MSLVNSLLKPDLGYIPHNAGNLFRRIDSLVNVLARESGLDHGHVRCPEFPIRVNGCEIMRGAEQIQHPIDWSHKGKAGRGRDVDIEHIDVGVPGPRVKGGGVGILIHIAREPVDIVQARRAGAARDVDGHGRTGRAISRL